MPTYVFRGGRCLDKATGEPLVLSDEPIVSSPMVMKDSPGVIEPITGGWLEGRAARREFCKVHDVVEAGDKKPLNDGYAKNERFARAHGLKHESQR